MLLLLLAWAEACLTVRDIADRSAIAGKSRQRDSQWLSLPNEGICQT